jgi:hypothetical protein
MRKLSSIITRVISGYIVVAIILTLSSASVAKAHDFRHSNADSAIIEGRWDITVDVDGKKLPSWLEVRHSGVHGFVGKFTGVSGSARPISKVNFTDGKMSFSIPSQWDKENNDLSVEGTLEGDNLSGSMTFPNGKIYNWAGKRAPALRRKTEPAWGKPIQLFNGKNLDGWHASGENQWKAKAGILRSPQKGVNLATDKTFTDFKLHIEFRYTKGSNSGVYLRGRYEVQVIDSKGSEPSSVLLGGVYGYISPSEMVAKAPGEWQAYDITLAGRMVTVVANGKTIICNQEIPGITGGALDSNEDSPGPIVLQGDEEGSVDYRNIVITPAK